MADSEKEPELILEHSIIDEYGNRVSQVIWKVPKSDDKPHGYKYSLAYIVNDERVIGYDNAEGKGDHRHYAGKKVQPYEFKGIRLLTIDFMNDIYSYWEKHCEDEDTEDRG